MSGHGTVIAGIYLVSLFLAASYTYVDSINSISRSSMDSIRNASASEIARLWSAVSITSLSESGRIRLYVQLSNSGKVKIVRSDFSRIDILLTYVVEATSTKGTYWAYYSSSNQALHRWELDSSFNPNPFPSDVNPLDWDPSETLAIIIRLPNNVKIKDRTSGYLIVGLPSGSTVGQSFST